MKIFSKSQNKIILVMYAGIKDMPDHTAKEYLKHLNEYGHTFDSSIYTIVIPDKYSYELKVECLNPVVLSKEQYNRVDNIIREAEEKLKNIL